MSRGCGNGVTCGSLLHGLHLQQRFNKLSQFRAVNSMINFGRIKDDKRCNLLSCKMFIGLPGKNYHGNIENKGGSKPVGTRWNHISSNHQFFSPVKKKWQDWKANINRWQPHGIVCLMLPKAIEVVQPLLGRDLGQDVLTSKACEGQSYPG